MVLLVNPAYVGIEHNDARPRAYTKTSKFTTWYGDQACLYEEITGAPVPGAASLTATPHVHDGVNGAIIPIPLVQSSRRINLPPRPSDSSLWDSGTQYEGFFPFAWAPFFAPAGVSQVLVVMHASATSFGSFRIETQDDSLATLTQKRGGEALFSSPTPGATGHWLHSPLAGNVATLAWVCDVTAGAVNVLKMEAWDGYYDETWAFSGDGILLRDREVYGWAVLPITQAPVAIAPSMTPAITDNVRVKVPSSFTPFDSHLVANGRAISSYHLVTPQKNDAMLYELLTDRPAGNRSATTVRGHIHGDPTDLNNSGADMDQALGAWAYGTLRPPGSASGYSAADVPGSGLFDNIWSNFIAPQLHATNASTGTPYTLFYHRVRVPAATSAHLANGTGKLKMAALVYDNGTDVKVTAALGNQAATSFDTVSDVTAGSVGRSVVTISDLECSRPEEVNALRVQLGWGTQKSASAGIYGTCLYYDKA